MNTDYANARPPRWAEALLWLLLKPKDRESISGDLLEEYRDTIVPTLGRAAPRWYIRQAGSLVLRASWGWGAALGLALIIRYLFDMLIPPTDYRVRAIALTYTIFGVYVLAGFRTALRTESMRAGVLTSFSAAMLGAFLSIAGTGAMLAIWHDPAIVEQWRRSGGLREAFIDVPLKLIAIAVVIGAAGAVFGKYVAKNLATDTSA